MVDGMEDIIINGKKADTQEVVETLERRTNARKNRKLWYAENDSNFWEYTKKIRESRKNKKADMRLIASIPEELYQAICDKYGVEVFRDEKLFKEILKREEKLQWGLTVPASSL